MIIKIGNIFESKCSTIVNTVNCVGIMGKGIALEYKRKYPCMYDEYVELCKKGKVQPGTPYVYQDLSGIKIINFPTKDHWRSPSRLSYVIDGLDWFIEHYKEYNIDSVAFPPLGCGNGGLDWSVVGQIMYQKLCSLPITVEIYAPFGTAKKEITSEYLQNSINIDEVNGKVHKKINPKWYLILYIIRVLNTRKHSLKVDRTIYQKICYVITRNGVDTGFRFSKGAYGPYSTDVKESIVLLANSNLLIEKQLGKMVSLQVSDNVVVRKEEFSQKEWMAVKKTIDLFGRVKSTEQAEMIATVLYAYDELAKSLTKPMDKEIYDYVLSWKPHWKSSKDFEICDTIQNLAMLSMANIVHSDELMDTMLF